MVGDMLCLGGSLLFATATILQEIMLSYQPCSEYLAFLGLFGTVICCVQTFCLDLEELMDFNWYEVETSVQLGGYCIIQTLYQILQCFVLRDAGAIVLHLSFLSSEYYTLIAGMYIFQFKFHALYWVSFALALLGVVLYSARPTLPQPPPPGASPPTPHLPQLVSDAVHSRDNVSMDYTVPELDCIPIEGLEPPVSRDTTFTSFLGGHGAVQNGNIGYGHINGLMSHKDAC